MVSAKPMTFSGSCNGCGKNQDEGPGVDFLCDDRLHRGDVGTWVCIACARRLALGLTKASDKAVAQVRRGFVQRHDKWVKKSARVSVQP